MKWLVWMTLLMWMTWLALTLSLAHADDPFRTVIFKGEGSVDKCKRNQYIGILEAYYGMSTEKCYPPETHYMHVGCSTVYNNEEFKSDVCDRCHERYSCKFNPDKDYPKWGDPAFEKQKKFTLVYECYPNIYKVLQTCPSIKLNDVNSANFNVNFKYACVFSCSFTVSGPKEHGIMVTLGSIDLSKSSSTCCNKKSYSCDSDRRVVLTPDPIDGDAEKEDQLTICSPCQHTEHLCFRTNRIRVHVYTVYLKKVNITFKKIQRDVEKEDECPQYERDKIKQSVGRRCRSQDFFLVGDVCFRKTPIGVTKNKAQDACRALGARLAGSRDRRLLPTAAAGGPVWVADYTSSHSNITYNMFRNSLSFCHDNRQTYAALCEADSCKDFHGCGSTDIDIGTSPHLLSLTAGRQDCDFVCNYSIKVPPGHSIGMKLVRVQFNHDHPAQCDESKSRIDIVDTTTRHSSICDETLQPKKLCFYVETLDLKAHFFNSPTQNKSQNLRLEFKAENCCNYRSPNIELVYPKIGKTIALSAKSEDCNCHCNFNIEAPSGKSIKMKLHRASLNNKGCKETCNKKHSRIEIIDHKNSSVSICDEKCVPYQMCFESHAIKLKAHFLHNPFVTKHKSIKLEFQWVDETVDKDPECPQYDQSLCKEDSDWCYDGKDCRVWNPSGAKCSCPPDAEKNLCWRAKTRIYVRAETDWDMGWMLNVSLHTRVAQVPPFFQAHVTVYSLIARHQPDFQTDTRKTFAQQGDDDLEKHDIQQRTCACPKLPEPCPGQNVVAPSGLDHLRGCTFVLPLDHQRRLYKISILLKDNKNLVEQLPTSLLWPRLDGGRRKVHGNIFFTGE